MTPRRLAGNWDVAFETVVPDASAAKAKASALAADPSSFGEAMTKNLKDLGVSDEDAAVNISSFAASEKLAAEATTAEPSASNSSASSTIWYWLAAVALLCCCVGGIGGYISSRKKKRGKKSGSRKKKIQNPDEEDADEPIATRGVSQAASGPAVAPYSAVPTSEPSYYAMQPAPPPMAYTIF
jgi:hypothetical protein